MERSPDVTCTYQQTHKEGLNHEKITYSIQKQVHLNVHKIYGIKKDIHFIHGRLSLTAVLQHYLSKNDEIRKPFRVCITLGFSLGILTIRSLSSQSRASQIRSKCSKFTLSTNSWYNSPIVLGRMPVALAKSACVHLISPSLVDSKILIIRHCSFRYKIA